MSKRSNFKRISCKRVQKLKDDLLRLTHFNNHQYYEFTDDDILNIYRDLKNTLDIVYLALINKSRFDL